MGAGVGGLVTRGLLVRVLALCIAALCAFVYVAEAQGVERVEGGALYLTRQFVETHRAEFDVAADCEHIARILNEAEPRVDWHCSTSVPDVFMDCEISDFKLDLAAPTSGLPQVEFPLRFSLVLNRGIAYGRSDLGVPLNFEYTQSESSYLLVSDYPYAAGNYFTMAVYSLIIDTFTGSVEVLDIGGKRNGTGQCSRTER